MIQFFKLLGSAMLFSVGVCGASIAASFDCSKAVTEIETAICADPDLSALDDRLGELWKQTVQSNDVVSDQRRWLEKRDESIFSISDLVADRGVDVEWELIRYLRSLYAYRIVELVSGCQVKVNLLELFDDKYTIEELDTVIKISSNLENCIDNHYRTISNNFELVSSSLSILPDSCVISVEPFMYPISERVGHSIHSRCASNQITRYQILHDAMLHLIFEKSTTSVAVLAADQRNWTVFSEASCGFFSDWGLHEVERVAPDYCRLNVLKFRLLYLSPFVGIDDFSGRPAGSINELLGPYYGFN